MINFEFRSGRANLGALQCWCGKDGNLHRRLQALARLQGQQREEAVHQGHRA